ncbi:trypsin eta [Stomoxys calcitrans]|uniref:trypsin eta n=1 Tax=Stomoxys calcitrans TaxID=35570 RepID=UPI0027E36A4A|nr:trypsin eta [Stomoxys calcitrans]
MVNHLKIGLLGVLVIFCIIAGNEGKDQTHDEEEHDPDPEISINDAKYQASLRLVSLEKTKGYGHGHLCSGSIITQRVILTAAHCVVNASKTPPSDHNADEFVVVVGSGNLYDKADTLQYNVKKIVKHNSFDSKTYYNDIALLYLNDSIPWTWPTAKAISLNSKLVPEQTMCNATSWLREEDCKPTKLLSITVPIISHETCAYRHENVSESVICGGHELPPGEEEESCQGDAGGSLVCNGKLAGVVFRGDGMGRPNNPGIFTNVSYFYDWIVKTNGTFDYKNSANGLSVSSAQILILLFSVLGYNLF